MWGNHYIKSWSRGQSVVALSSAEAEFYAAVKATCEWMGIINILAEWDIKLIDNIYADASAALGIINRTGIGKIRHLETQHLWIQEVRSRKGFDFKKIGGESNPADLLTKALNSELINRHVSFTNNSCEPVVDHVEGAHWSRE